MLCLVSQLDSENSQAKKGCSLAEADSDRVVVTTMVATDQADFKSDLFGDLLFARRGF